MTTTIHRPATAPRVLFLRFLALLAFLGAGGAMVACSTTEGFGKDVKHLGGDIEDKAAENK